MPLFSRPRPGTIDEGRPACARSASRRSGAPVAARLEADRHLAQQAWVATLSGAGSDLPLSTLTEAQCVLFVEEARRRESWSSRSGQITSSGFLEMNWMSSR